MSLPTRSCALLLLPLLACEEPLAPPEPPPSAARCEVFTAEAHEVLSVYCAGCHQARAEGGLNYILDASKLVTRGKVVPGDVEGSRLLSRILDETMPPRYGEPAPPVPSEAEVKSLEGWVSCGAPALDAAPVRPFFSPHDQLALIDEDLAEMDREDWRFVRYLSLAHLYNAGVSEGELGTLRNGTAKLLNSLSWNPRLRRPVELHPGLLRIDLRHYGWAGSAAVQVPTLDVWAYLVEQDPYGLNEGPLQEALAAQLRTPIPVLRADWLVHFAARPPAYHDILRMPDTAQALEALLGVDVAQNIFQDPPQAMRAGFRASGVSRNNRLIERHPSRLGRGYAYWKSYDFGPVGVGSQGPRRNLFDHPLGPGIGPRDFAHDGGELIFNLPNGLQAYMLVDAAGARIDKGPVDIVRDERRPDAAVVNGLSCMSCHARGMIDKGDELRSHVLDLAPEAFGSEERRRVAALYPEAEVFAAALKADRARFESALEALDVPFAETEPVVTLAEAFEESLGVAQAAAELGLTRGAFEAALKANGDLARTFGSLETVGVERAVFQARFAELSCRLRPSTCAALPVVQRPVDPDACDGSARIDGRCNGCPSGTVVPAGWVCVPPGEFRMGSPPEEPGHTAGERQRRVALRHPLLVQRTPTPRAQAPDHGRFEGCGEDCPVESIDWFEAAALANTLSVEAGALPCYLRADGALYGLEDVRDARHPIWREDCDGLRLPTEAEWEYAARAGSEAAIYTGQLTVLAQNHAPELDAIAWYAGNSGVDYGGYAVACDHWADRRVDADYCGVHPVGEKAGNRWGLHDMLGNVAEWCWDWFDDEARGGADPEGPANGEAKVIRGGSWSHTADSIRSAARGHHPPSERADFIGVRFVRTVK